MKKLNVEPYQIRCGDVLKEMRSLPDESIHCIITSPPYWQKPEKCLSMIPAYFAIQCTEAGWILRNDIIWAKPNGMPESVKDRFSNRQEHVFFFTKSSKYYFNLDAVREKYSPASLQRNQYRGKTRFAYQIVIFQRTTQKMIRGGTALLYDAGINIEVVIAFFLRNIYVEHKETLRTAKEAQRRLAKLMLHYQSVYRSQQQEVEIWRDEAGKNHTRAEVAEIRAANANLVLKEELKQMLRKEVGSIRRNLISYSSVRASTERNFPPCFSF